MENLTKRLGLVLMACALAIPAFAQGLGQVLPTGEGVSDKTPADGFHIYSISLFSQYSTQALPFGAALPSYGADLGPATTLGGGGSLGWMRHRQNSDISITYSGYYDSNLRYSQWSSAIQSLSIAAHRSLGPRWNYSFSANGSTSTWDQFLFSPGIFSWVSDPPPTFDQLVAGTLSGKYTSDQIASLLTGAPIVESPVRTVLFGTRVLMSSLQTGFSYQSSPRLSVFFKVGASRFQNLYDQTLRNLAGSRYLVPETTTGTASIGLSYALTPRTQFGVDLSSDRIFSSYEQAYISTLNFTLGRRMGRRWLAEGRAGAGTIEPIKSVYRIPGGPRYTLGGLIGYHTFSQSFTLSGDRMITDTFGLAAQSTISATGSWGWHRPGRSWSLFTAGTDQRFDIPGFRRISGWIASAGLTRQLSRQMTVELAYAHAVNSAGQYLQNPTFTADSARLVLSWSPEAMHR